MGDNDAALAQMISMGFDATTSSNALTATSGNVDRAVQMVLGVSMPAASLVGGRPAATPPTSLTGTNSNGGNGRRSQAMKEYDERLAQAWALPPQDRDAVIAALGPPPSHDPLPSIGAPPPPSRTVPPTAGAPVVVPPSSQQSSQAMGSGAVSGAIPMVAVSTPAPLDGPESKRGPTTALPTPPVPSPPVIVSTAPPPLPSVLPPPLPSVPPPSLPRVTSPPAHVISPSPSFSPTSATPTGVAPPQPQPQPQQPLSYARQHAWNDGAHHGGMGMAAAGYYHHNQSPSSAAPITPTPAPVPASGVPQFDNSVFGSAHGHHMGALTATGTPLVAPKPGSAHSFVHHAPAPAPVAPYTAPAPTPSAYHPNNGYNGYNGHNGHNGYGVHPYAHHQHNGSMSHFPPVTPMSAWGAAPPPSTPTQTPNYGGWQQPSHHMAGVPPVWQQQQHQQPVAAAPVIIQREICPIFRAQGTCVLLDMDPDHGNQWLHTHTPQSQPGAPSIAAPPSQPAPMGCEHIPRHGFGRCNINPCLITEIDDPAHHWMFGHSSSSSSSSTATSTSSVPNVSRDPSVADPFSPRGGNGSGGGAAVDPPEVKVLLAPGLNEDGSVMYKGQRYCTFAPCPKLVRTHPEYEEHKNSRLHFCEHGPLCSRIHNVEHRGWYFHSGADPCGDDDNDACSHVPAPAVIRDQVTAETQLPHHQQNIHMLLNRHRCPLGLRCPALEPPPDELVARYGCHTSIYVHPCAAGLDCEEGTSTAHGAAHQLTFTHPCTLAQHCRDQSLAHTRQYTHTHTIKGEAKTLTVRRAAPPLVGFHPEPSCPNGHRCMKQFLHGDDGCHMDHKESKIHETTAGKNGMRNPVKDFWYAPNQPVLVTSEDGTVREGWMRGRQVARTPYQFPLTTKMVVSFSDGEFNCLGNQPISRVLVLVNASQCKPMDDGKTPNPSIGGPLAMTVSIADLPRIAPPKPDCRHGAACTMLSPLHHNHAHHCSIFAHPSSATATAAASAAPVSSSVIIPSDSKASFIGRRWNAPWYHPMVRAWKSELTRELHRVLTTKIVPGLTVNYLTVISEFNDNGYGCFVMGGAVRDCLMGGGGVFAPQDPEDMKIKDIDLGFGCSAEEAKAMCDAKGWPSSINHTGLVTLGARTSGGSDLVLEGKPTMGLNADYASMSIKEPHKYPFTISCDLHAENCYGDFACNRLWYDAVNEVIWDPTGYGVHDSVHRLLRIPVPWADRDTWVATNPTKLLRYWKMKCRRFKPVDDDTHRWFVAKTNELFGVPVPPFTPEWVIKYIGKDALGFRRGIQEDLGKPWWDKWFDKFWQKYHAGK